MLLSPEILQALLLGAVGLMAGWLNVLAGGGSVLTISAMLLTDMPATVANGTNRIGILAQNIVAVTTFYRHGYHHIWRSITLATMATIGAIGGAMMGLRLDGPWFSRLLAMVMVAVLIATVTDNKKASDTAADKGLQESGAISTKRLLFGHLIMIFVGIWGGFIQIGVGFLMMPLLHKVLRLNLIEVNMHKVFIIMIYTAIALLIFAHGIEIRWLAGCALACGTMAGGWLGARATIQHGAKWIKRAFCTTLGVLIIKLLFFG